MKRRPVGITTNIAAALGIIDTRFVHSGLTGADWLVIVGAVAAIVSYRTPRD